jgi:hypothetical protein
MAVDASTFEALRRTIRPRADELRWTEIPWVTDLWEGRRRARREDRPIFLWAMNGHPLGCV